MAIIIVTKKQQSSILFMLRIWIHMCIDSVETEMNRVILNWSCEELGYMNSTGWEKIKIKIC